MESADHACEETAHEKLDRLIKEERKSKRAASTARGRGVVKGKIELRREASMLESM